MQKKTKGIIEIDIIWYLVSWKARFQNQQVHRYTVHQQKEMLSIRFLKNQEWKQTTFESEREISEFSIDSLSLSLFNFHKHKHTHTHGCPKTIDFNQKAIQNRP